MEFSKAQVAALVLGYLKSEKLSSVVEEFVKCCSYFEGNHKSVKMGKYFVTRVAGLTLVDFLEQYSEIYTIVQSRIEETNFYSLYSRTTLVEQLLYLLDQDMANIATSTPLMNSSTSEVDATPAHALPGNSSFQESDNLMPKTPRKRALRSRSSERDAAVDVTDLRQSLLENHELHEKLAEDINNVRNTPEVGKVVSEENVSAGASKELEAVIKTVIQKTQEDPVYNKLIDEIIGTATYESPPNKVTFGTPTSSLNNNEDLSKSGDEAKKPGNMSDPMDDHNNAAIRSIIEASQNAELPPPPSETDPLRASNKPETAGEVYVFEGSLDSYLKSSGATNPNNQNAMFFNPPSLIVVPPDETVPKQYYIVNNNQPLLKITEQEIMACPTIIVNDEKAPSTSTDQPPVPPPDPPKVKKPKVAKPARPRPRAADNLPILPKIDAVFVPQARGTEEAPVQQAEMAEAVTSASADSESAAAPAPRQASHVRNLDFSSPSCDTTRHRKKGAQAWDAALRQLVGGPKQKSPTPKKKRPVNTRKKKNKQDDDNQVEDPLDRPEPVEQKEENDIDVKDVEKIGLVTPVKDTLPKTPGGMLDSSSSMHCTPFNDVIIEEQLEGVDLSLIPTPSLPITPGFALTPGDGLITNQRLTDYSTSSSYYQPSDSEQKVTMCQLLEECERLEKKSEDSKLKVVSDVVIEEAKVPEKKKPEEKKANERLKKFNNNVIGKKNLSLLRHATSSTSSSSSGSASDSDENDKPQTLKKETVKNAETEVAVIKDIIETVQVKSTLDEKQVGLLRSLETVRRRTVDKIKKCEPSKSVRNNRKAPRTTKASKAPPKPKTPRATKKAPKKKETPAEDTTDEEAKKLVQGLAQRGIHLIPNKTPQKKVHVTEIPKHEDLEDVLAFDRKVYDTFETPAHGDRSCKKRTLKHYDLSLLKKSMAATVFVEDLNEEVTRVMRWTACECLLDPQKLQDARANDDLMDFVVGGLMAPSTDCAEKGGKKRKTRFADNNQQKDKKKKVYDESMKLLNVIDVDVFLDKVHGE